MFESINDIINAIVTYILSWTGASTAGPQNPEFQLIRNGVIAIIVLFAITAQWLARRIYIVRKIWDPRCKLEGYWIEEIRRGSSVFVTIVRLSFKNWTSRKYTIYGETWNFSNHPDEEIKIYAKFQSDAIHFDIGDDICLTFNYNSRIFGETIEQSIGLAQYHFTDQDKKVGLGWFVSVVDSDSRLKKDMHIDHCDLK